jgi:hypothetical protein
MTSPKIGAPEGFVDGCHINVRMCHLQPLDKAFRSKADVISIIRKAVPLTASLMLLTSSLAFAARPHQTRADDLARLTYKRQLTGTSG